MEERERDIQSMNYALKQRKKFVVFLLVLLFSLAEDLLLYQIDESVILGKTDALNIKMMI